MSSVTQTTDGVTTFIPLCHVMVFLLLLDLPVSSKIKPMGFLCGLSPPWEVAPYSYSN